MIKHKSYGFTVVELIVVIVVIAVLVSITAIAYRSTQAESRDKNRMADIMILRSAIDEYQSDMGTYPLLYTCTLPPGGSSECANNEVWEHLKTAGYLEKIPTPQTKSARTDMNVVDGGKYANYVYLGNSSSSYAIYVPLEGGDCKAGKNVLATWWDSVKTCDF